MLWLKEFSYLVAAPIVTDQLIAWWKLATVQTLLEIAEFQLLVAY